MTGALMLLLGGTNTASAQDAWSSFRAAFPLFPCQDGWSACMAYGEHIDAATRTDSGGRALPSDARVGWFDLKATSSFSPFVGLSQYTDEAVAAADPAPVDPGADAVAAAEETEAAEMAVDQATADADAARASDQEAQRAQREAQAARQQADQVAQQQRAEEERMRREAAEASRRAAAASQVAEAAEQATLRREAEEASARMAEQQRKRAEAEREAQALAAAQLQAEQRAAAELERSKAAERARQEAADAKAAADALRARQEAADAKTAADAAKAAAEAAKLAAVKPPEGTTKVTPPPPIEGGSECADLQALETKALLGQLPTSTTSCLESALASAPKMTDKKRISSVLMANAWAKADKEGWEALVKRHLDDIDQSDPDLCYKYALHLSRQGPSRASGVIRWSNVALENRMVWIGDTYTSRVYSLYKVRAAASQALWMAAEQEHTANPTDATSDKVDKYRNLTKVNAREWFEYAKESQKDANLALQLCMSAAGTADYCGSN